MATPEILLLRYERGLITFDDLVGSIIPTTVEIPTAELIARLPDGAMEVLRELASYPTDTEWIGRKADVWLHGLTIWRAYFGFTE